MDPIAAKYIGAGIACIGMGGAGIGVGTIFGNYLAAALRNPSRISARICASRRVRPYGFCCVEECAPRGIPRMPPARIWRRRESAAGAAPSRAKIASASRCSGSPPYQPSPMACA